MFKLLWSLENPMTHPAPTPQRRGVSGRWWHTWGVAALALSCTACGTMRQLPPAFDITAVDISAGQAATVARVEGASGKLAGSGWGAAKGSGWGLLVGLLGESGCSMVCGASTVVGTVVGAVVGAVFGGLTSESETEVDAQREWLKSEVARSSSTQRLADLLRVGLPGSGAAAAARPWQVVVTVVDASAAVHAKGWPYALRLKARLGLRRLGDDGPAADLDFEARAQVEPTGNERDAAAAASLHSAIEVCVRSLAAQIVAVLQPAAQAPTKAAA